MKKFKGVYPVAVTAFTKEGEFDFEKSKKHLDYLIENGIKGICILGATSEYQSITIDEHKQYVNEIVPYIKNRVSVIVGVTREMPDEVIDLINNATLAGAHGAMILPTYYCHPSQDEIFEFYSYIQSKTTLPLMLYNNPYSAGVEIEKETYQKLMNLERVEIVKESSGNIRKLTEVLLDAPEKVSVFCGWDNMSFESFVTGANGWISMLANIAPSQCTQLFKAIHDERDYKKGFEIYKSILPALNILEGFPKPVQVIKYVLKEKGKDVGYVRRPRIELNDAEKEFISKEFPIHEIY